MVRYIFTIKIAFAFLLGILGGQQAGAQVILLDRVTEYLQNDQLQQARDAIDLATENEATKGDQRTWYLKGFTYKELYNAHPDSSADFRDTALQALEKCQAMDDTTFTGDCSQVMSYIYTTYFNDAVEAFNSQRYQGALDTFQIYIDYIETKEEQPNYAEALYYAGFASYILEKDQQAREYYEGALEKEFYKPLLYDNLSTIYQEQGEETLALEMIRKGRDRYPENNNLHISLINLLLAQEKYFEAEKEVESYLEKDPQNVEVMLVAGTIYGQIAAMDTTNNQKYFQKRKRIYEKALAEQPDNPTANYNLGILLYNKSVDLINNDAENYEMDLGAFNQLLNRCTNLFKEAIPYLTKVREMDPANRKTLKALENIYHYLNRKQELANVRQQLDSLDK